MSYSHLSRHSVRLIYILFVIDSDWPDAGPTREQCDASSTTAAHRPRHFGSRLSWSRTPDWSREHGYPGGPWPYARYRSPCQGSSRTLAIFCQNVVVTISAILLPRGSFCSLEHLGVFWKHSREEAPDSGTPTAPGTRE